MNIKLYADGAVLETMLQQYKENKVQGFTTNPSLMKKGGVQDYNAFAQKVLESIPDLSISFEVFGDDFETMEKEAKKISSFGKNVFVKIPIMNTKGESSIPLIKKLSAEGLNLNVTAIFTLEQVRDVVDAVNEEAHTYVSVFAGRLADLGIDPKPMCREKKNGELLWASTRETFNVFEAEEIGVDIITCPADVLNKLENVGKVTPEEMSRQTVQGFNKDIQSLGFSIL